MSKRHIIGGVALGLLTALSAPLVAHAAAGPTCTVGASGADYTTIQQRLMIPTVLQ